MSIWTPEAQQRWEQIPIEMQECVLAQIWCPACGELRQMLLDSGSLIRDDLVIAGRCTMCGHRVARLLEGEARPRSSQGPLQVGEPVIWLKRLPGGPYVEPFLATVVAITPKRIKIIVDDDGKTATRFVPLDSLQRRT